MELIQTLCKKPIGRCARAHREARPRLRLGSHGESGGEPYMVPTCFISSAHEQCALILLHRTQSLTPNLPFGGHQMMPSKGRADTRDPVTAGRCKVYLASTQERVPTPLPGLSQPKSFPLSNVCGGRIVPSNQPTGSGEQHELSRFFYLGLSEHPEPRKQPGWGLLA